MTNTGRSRSRHSLWHCQWQLQDQYCTTCSTVLYCPQRSSRQDGDTAPAAAAERNRKQATTTIPLLLNSYCTATGTTRLHSTVLSTVVLLLGTSAVFVKCSATCHDALVGEDGTGNWEWRISSLHHTIHTADVTASGTAVTSGSQFFSCTLGWHGSPWRFSVGSRLALQFSAKTAVMLRALLFFASVASGTVPVNCSIQNIALQSTTLGTNLSNLIKFLSAKNLQR